MLTEKTKLKLNKIFLVASLTISRLPKLVGYENDAWVILLSLIPFWYLILVNHSSYIETKVGKKRKLFGIFFQLLSLIIIFGVFLIVSYLFVRFSDKNTIAGLLFGSIPILAVIITSLFYGVSKIRRTGLLEVNLLWIGLAYFVILVISMYRSSFQASYDLLILFQTLTVLVFCLSSLSIIKKEEVDYFYYVFLGLVSYLVINVGLSLLGIENQSDSYLRGFQTVMLSLIGIDTTRTYYPLAEGINSFGMVAGLCLAISIGYFISAIFNKTKGLRVYMVSAFGVIISTYVILMTDSRGALLFSVMTGIIISFFVFFRSKLVFLICFLGQLSIFSALIGKLNNINFLAPLIRENTSLLSGRGTIWKAGLEYLSDFNWIHFIGYGLSGQAKSGLISEYSYLFASYINKKDIYLHHFGLQSVFDIGYIGLFIAYFLMVLMGFSILQKEKSEKRYRMDLPVFAGLLFIIFSGSVSIAPAIYAREIFFLFPFIWVSASSNK